MLGEIIQPPLFGTESFSDSKLVVETKLRNLGRDRVAFDVTKTILNKGRSVLENIFYGMHNLEIPLEILSIENPAEILSEYFAAGSLKRRNAHLNAPHILRDFFILVNNINRYSYDNKKFASLAYEFKKCFDSRPWEQKKRLELLEQDVRDRFVESFFSPYKFSDEENSFGYDFHDPGSKEDYVNIIYEELKSLSEEAKQI